MNALLANQNVSASLGKFHIENIRGKTNTNIKKPKNKKVQKISKDIFFKS